MSLLQHVAACIGHLHIILSVRRFFNCLLYLLSCITLLGSVIVMPMEILGRLIVKLVRSTPPPTTVLFLFFVVCPRGVGE